MTCAGYDDNFKDLFPQDDTCQDCSYPPEDTAIYSSSPKYSDLRKKHEAAFDEKFKAIKAAGGSDMHAQLACLMHHMLTNIKSTTVEYIADDTEKNATIDKLATQKDRLTEYEKILKNSENSGLVTDYRNESTEKRNKKLNTYFTLYVTFIVIFLIVEGIVFFV
jgi:hypothetical protein